MPTTAKAPEKKPAKSAKSNGNGKTNGKTNGNGNGHHTSNDNGGNGHLTNNGKRTMFALPSIDFVAIVDGTNCLPNGDPDNENNPRQATHSGKALMTGECIRRKIRDSLQRKYGCELFVERGSVLGNRISETYEQAGIDVSKDSNRDDAEIGNLALCQRFIDARLFGAVIIKPGQGRITGPVTIHMAESVYAVRPLDPITLTRVAGSTQARSEDQNGRNQEMGSRTILPHVVFKITGSVDPNYAMKTGATPDDLQMFFEAFQKCFAFSQSQSRGIMTMRELFIFKHRDVSRNCQPATAYEAVTVEAKLGAKAQSWQDYTVTVSEDLPPGLSYKRIPVTRDLPEGLILQATSLVG